ncbi:Uncharacterised protein [Mycobacteroides abscessus subsp. bolletii]|nr:Uncharacterised protein [Mycobacteroides abscessus subsp. bolletii]
MSRDKSPRNHYKTYWCRTLQRWPDVQKAHRRVTPTTRRTLAAFAIAAVMIGGTRIVSDETMPGSGFSPVQTAAAEPTGPPAPTGGMTDGGGQGFQPPQMPSSMPDYQGGNNQPPLDQNSGISIYNSGNPQAPQQVPGQQSGQQPQQAQQPAHGTQIPDYQTATPFTQGPGRPNPDYQGPQQNSPQQGQQPQQQPQQQQPSQAPTQTQQPQNKQDDTTQQLNERQQQCQTAASQMGQVLSFASTVGEIVSTVSEVVSTIGGGGSMIGGELKPGRDPVPSVPACYPFCDYQTYKVVQPDGTVQEVTVPREPQQPNVIQNDYKTPRQLEHEKAVRDFQQLKDDIGRLFNNSNYSLKCDPIGCEMHLSKDLTKWVDDNSGKISAAGGSLGSICLQGAPICSLITGGMTAQTTDIAKQAIAKGQCLVLNAIYIPPMAFGPWMSSIGACAA